MPLKKHSLGNNVLEAQLCQTNGAAAFEQCRGDNRAEPAVLGAIHQGEVQSNMSHGPTAYVKPSSPSIRTRDNLCMGVAKIRQTEHSRALTLRTPKNGTPDM